MIKSVTARTVVEGAKPSYVSHNIRYSEQWSDVINKISDISDGTAASLLGMSMIARRSIP